MYTYADCKQCVPNTVYKDKLINLKDRYLLLRNHSRCGINRNNKIFVIMVFMRIINYSPIISNF